MNLTNDELAVLSRERTALEAFIRYLAATGYTLPGIAKLLGEPDPTSLLRNTAWSALIHDQELRRNTSALACLTRLFLLGGRVTRSSFESIPVAYRTLLEKLSLVQAVGDDSIGSTVTIVEFDSDYFLSDRLFELSGDELTLNTATDAVWPMAEWSLRLYQSFIRNSQFRTLLDVGSGTGCLSILSRSRYVEMHGIDLNPRAVGFSNLNALLAGIESARYRTADCFSFDTQQTFDHIVFASPGGPNAGGISSMVSDGGRLGHELLVRFLAGPLDRLLATRGACQVWGVFAVEEHFGSIEKLLAHSLPRDRFSISVIPIREGGLYLSRAHIQGNTLPRGCHYGPPAQLLPFLRNNGVIEVLSAVVTLQRT